MASIDYEIVKSKRKTLGLEVKSDGRVVVRAPMRTSNRDIDAFVESHRDWILRKQAKMAHRLDALSQVEPMSADELSRLKAMAKEEIPRRVERFARIIGVSYGNITIRTQKTRWGSCTSKGNLSFNCLLMLAPSDVLDSVIVHELCHRKHMNHSKDFYAEVIANCPDYRKSQRWLKDNGPALLRRVPR